MHTLYASSPQWAALAGRLDELLAGPDFHVLKSTSRTLAGVLRVHSNEVFVKRITTDSTAAGLAARISGSHARRALRGARALQQAGFAHPQPIAAFEKRSFGLVSANYIVAELLRRPRILSRFALSDGRNFQRRRWISAYLADEIRRLHDAGCYTRDLQETNLMLEAREGQLLVYFIDLEDFRRFRQVPRRLRMRNLLHLDRSIGRFLSRTQRLRFLYNYLGGKPAHQAALEIVNELLDLRQRFDHRKRGERRNQALIPSSSHAAADEPKSSG